MESIYLVTFSTMFTVMFFLIGGIIGWIANRHFLETRPPYLHPEFMDENGNLIPDEIVAVRFENGLDYDEDEYDDE
jgi:hypothetical protein